MILRALAFLLLLTTPAFAGSYTVTTTPAQDRALAALAARQGITVEDVVRAHVLNGLAVPAVLAQQAARAQRYREMIDALTPAERARVLQDLGLSE